MSRPRTPVHWPRMKVRGARRKQKTAARVTYRHEFLGIPTPQADGAVTFRLVARAQPGAMRLVVTKITDGWGRPAHRPRLDIPRRV